tara:strand:- start:32 stop:388 length:357 start_codon:yes stop_codon:yes gene_type:complete
MKYRYLVTQPDLNAHGTLHGGILMKWVDEACGMEARLLTGGVCATRHIRDIDFRSTARIGDIISIKVSEIKIGRTSITYSAFVKNEVSGLPVANFDNLVFVAVDEENKAVPHNILRKI